MSSRRGKYYCDFKNCKPFCLIPMSGEDCYTLGLVTGQEAKDYEDWLKKEEEKGSK